MAVTIKGRVIANSPAVLLRRVQGLNGAYMVNADVTGVVVKVFDMLTGLQSGATLDSSVTTIYDTLQTGAIWQGQDSIGYNLSISVPGSALPTEGRYRVQALVTPVVGGAFELLWDVDSTKTF
jgi:hypothetical protein